jgi:hypothetical protein
VTAASEQLYRCLDPRGRGETPIGCEQGSLDDLGQRHLGGVVGGQVLSQDPDSGKQGGLRIALDVELSEVFIVPPSREQRPQRSQLDLSGPLLLCTILAPTRPDD